MWIWYYDCSASKKIFILFFCALLRISFIYFDYNLKLCISIFLKAGLNISIRAKLYFELKSATSYDIAWVNHAHFGMHPSICTNLEMNESNSTSEIPYRFWTSFLTSDIVAVSFSLEHNCSNNSFNSKSISFKIFIYIKLKNELNLNAIIFPSGILCIKSIFSLKFFSYCSLELLFSDA